MFAILKLFIYLYFTVICVLTVPIKHELREKRSIDLISSLEHLADTRLPRDVTPSGYRLELQPFLEEAEFQGHITINITCQEDTDKITLHAHQELEISESDVTVTYFSLQPVKRTTTTTTTTTETPVAHVPVGAARLLPVSSSFVPENGCSTSCPASVSNYLHNSPKIGRMTSSEELNQESETPADAINDDSKLENSPDSAQEGGDESAMGQILVPLTISRTERQNLKQRYIIYLSDRLKRGEHYQLALKFTGPLPSDTRDGFFLQSYRDKETGENRPFVATQMRPNHARRVFPCFDEPNFKVPFEISIAHTTNLTALSNMPIRQTEQSEPGWVWDHFQRTPPISTYSLAFIVSDFGHVKPSVEEEDDDTDITDDDSKEEDDTCSKVKVYGRKELLPNLQQAANIAPKAIKELQEYLGIPLPLPKLDLVALPGYSAVPDSDWGLIIFKESDLALTSEEVLIQHITREIVYQWVGDLVTPHWWSEAHINKALANFISTIIAMKIDKNIVPNSSLWTKNYPLYYEYGRIHPYKQLPSQKPPNTVTKSELILRMLNYTLSAQTFKKGIRHFINERQFKTFTQDDIWTALTEQAGEDETLPEPATINQIAESWLNKERLPYVKVTRNYENKTAEVEQNVFIREVRDEGSEDIDNKLAWWIPLVLVKEDTLNFSNGRPVSWMKEERRVTLENLPTPEKFIIVNPEEIGPFLVNYDALNWNLLSDYLEKHSKNPTIPSATRAKLVHDALNLAYGGMLRFDSALNTTKFLYNERDPIVWQPAFNMFDHILRHLDGSDTGVRFQEYLEYLVTPTYEDLSKMEGLTTSQERMLRSAKSTLCNGGYSKCIEEARSEWQTWMRSEEPDAGIPIQQQYFCWVFKWGTKDEWEFGLERYLNYPQGRNLADKYYLLKTLVSCPNNASLVERMLNLTILNSSGSTPNSIGTFVLSVLSNEVGYNALFNLLVDNWDTLRTKYEKNEQGLWDNIVNAATRNFKTREGLDLVSDLYTKRQVEFGTAEPIMEQSLKQIRQEVKWTEKNAPSIDSWLEDNLPEDKK